LASEQIGIGIIGLGGFGRFLVEQWGRMEEVSVVAASDEDEARALPEIKFHQDWKSLISDPAVQLVSIATPPSTHKEMALAAIAAGKHALIEKPLALNADDAGEIVRAANEAGVVCTVNFVLRYDPLVDLLRQAIASEVFGKVRRLDLRNYATQDGIPEGHWFWNPLVSGGIFIEHGVHFFDMASHLIGARPKDVKALTVHRRPDMEDRVFAAVVYESGVVGTFWHSFSRPRELERTRLHIAFDLGEIEVEGWIPLSASYWGWVDEAGHEALSRLLPDPAARVEKFQAREVRSSEFTYRVSHSVQGRYALPAPKLDVYGDCARSIVRDMVAAIRDPGHRLRVTAEDGAEAVAVAERAARAARGLC